MKVRHNSELWSGLANGILFKRHAYHIAFPLSASTSTSTSTSSSSDSNNNEECTVEDKLTLIGLSDTS
jgi:hypothetical protein